MHYTLVNGLFIRFSTNVQINWWREKYDRLSHTLMRCVCVCVREIEKMVKVKRYIWEGNKEIMRKSWLSREAPVAGVWLIGPGINERRKINLWEVKRRSQWRWAERAREHWVQRERVMVGRMCVELSIVASNISITRCETRIFMSYIWFYLFPLAMHVCVCQTLCCPRRSMWPSESSRSTLQWWRGKSWRETPSLDSPSPNRYLWACCAPSMCLVRRKKI